MGDFARRPETTLVALQPTAVLVLSALGTGMLDRALSLLAAGGLFGFARTPTLLPDSDPGAGRATGYPE